MRAALAVCERFQHESSSPCYRSSGGWVECSRLSESAASCGATSSADTTSSSPGSRYRAREARRSSARSLRFVGRRACTPSGQPGPFQSPCLNRPVDRQAYRSCRPSSSRLPPRQTRLSNRPGGAALRCIPPSCERGTSSASRACTGSAWDTSCSKHTSANHHRRISLSARAVQQRRSEAELHRGKISGRGGTSFLRSVSTRLWSVNTFATKRRKTSGWNSSTSIGRARSWISKTAPFEGLTEISPRLCRG